MQATLKTIVSRSTGKAQEVTRSSPPAAASGPQPLPAHLHAYVGGGARRVTLSDVCAPKHQW